MKSKRIVIIASILIVLVTFIIWCFLPITTAGNDLSFNWPAGTTYTYSLKYQSDNSTNLYVGAGGQEDKTKSFTVEMTLEGKLIVRSYGDKNDVFTLGYSLGNILTHKLIFMGQDVWADRAETIKQLVGPEMLVKIDSQGNVRKMLFPRDATPMFKNVMQTLIADSQIVLGEERPSWNVVEKTQLGNGLVKYNLSQTNSDGIGINKQRKNYTELKAFTSRDVPHPSMDVDSNFEVSISLDGHMTRFVGQENLQTKTGSEAGSMEALTKLDLVLEHVGGHGIQLMQQKLARFEIRKIGEIVVSQQAEERALRQRIGDMTVESMKSDFLNYANSGTMPFHTRWLWKATGLLELEPERCAELVPIFQDEKLIHEGRAMILDVLSSVGHEQAQLVMNKMLSSEQARTDDQFSMLLQRLSYIKKPTEETVAYAEQLFAETYRAGNADVEYSTAYSLGALSKNLRGQGELEVAKRLRQSLEDRLSSSNGPVDIAKYLSALGSAGTKANVEVAQNYANHEDPRVRTAVAVSIADVQTPKSEELILSLAADKSIPVQSQAFTVLHKYQVKPEHLSNLNELLTQNEIHPRNYSKLTHILDRQSRGQGPNREIARKTLQSLASKDLPTQLRKRIMGLLTRP